MRKITRQSVNAFITGQPFKGGNMLVEKCDYDGAVTMKLHGNTIAHDTGQEVFITSAGWQSNTTKERLNGLLQTLNTGGIHQKNFEWFLNDQPWDGEWIKVK